MFRFILILLFAIVFITCNQKNTNNTANYFNQKDTAKIKTGGIQMINIATPKGNYKVWTKRFGNNPTKKILLLHGGPGGTHEFLDRKSVV